MRGYHGAMPVTLRVLDPTAVDDDELDRIDAMLMRAYRMTSRRARVERFLALQPDGWVVAEHGGQVVGTGGCIAYPDGGFGWIGLVATDPLFQGRGVGRTVAQHLVERLAAHGCAPALDGSAMGAPLYEQMGFSDHGDVHALVAPAENAASNANDRGDREDRFDAINSAQLADIRAFDHERFGADRSRLLAHVLRAFPNRGRIARDADGHVRGFAFSQEDLIGPVVADEPVVAEALVRASLGLTWVAPPRILVPPRSAHLDMLLAMGFTEDRVLRHQRLGLPALPGRRESLCAQTSFGEG